MTQIDNKFRVKKGFEVTGDTSLLGDLIVAGNVNIPTQLSTDNSTKAASTAFVKTAINELIDASPGALDTLNELAAALGDDPNFASTLTTNLALKAPLASPIFTGIPAVPTAAASTNTTQVASTAYVKAQLASTPLTGVPTAPTASVDTSTTQLATTAFVTNQAADANPLANGVSSIGVSKRFARQDHVHDSDITKANLAGATFTGTVAIPDLDARGVIKNSIDHLYLQSSAVGKDIVFRTLNTTERAVIKSATGALLINKTVDNAVDILQVNGSISATVFKGSADLNGVPTAPTAVANTNTTQIATTAFVTSANNLKANAANPQFTGNATFDGIISSNYATIPMPSGGRYNSTAASVTGAIKISLPVLYADCTISFNLRVFEHSSGKTLDMIIAGKMQPPAINSWTTPSMIIIGEAAGKIPNIRFGNDGSKSCIWIGDIGTAWLIPHIQVSNVHVGYNDVDSSWANPWAISIETVLDTVKLGPLAPTKLASLVSPALTGTPTAPTAAANNNSTQLATTAYVDASASLKANSASPNLTGIPTAPTAAANTNTTQVATTAFVGTAVANLIASSPGALDTLNELAAALGNDPSFATTVTNSLSTKAPLISPEFVGVPLAPTAVPDTNTNQVATTAFVIAQGYAKINGSGYAASNSPIFTGNPTAPTAAVGDNDDTIATTAFVQNTINSVLTKSVAGATDVVLTATEAKNRVLILTGAITANINVVLPQVSGIWSISNKTTGAFTLTIKMASGFTAAIAQNYSDDIYSDAINLYRTQTDFTNIYLGGAPTSTTAIASDNSTRVATTAFVKSQSYIAASDTIDGGSY